MTSREPALVVRGVRRTFDTENVPVRALRGVDLEVRAGEFVAMTGPSGSGKSTLLSIIAGLDEADDGSVRLGGIELTGANEAERARIRRHHVGVVFQFFNLIDSMTAHQNVALAALVAGASRREANERAHQLLDLLGLLDRARTVPAVLSGGERQRLAIARALANEPTLLLADEPTGSLDSDSGAAVLALFRRLHRDGQAILLVTHDAAVAAAAERVVALRDGRVVP